MKHASLFTESLKLLYLYLTDCSLLAHSTTIFLLVMARFPAAAAALHFSFFLTLVQFSTCDVVKGSVSCADCSHQDLSGVRIAVKCGQEKKLNYALTDEDGAFEAKLPVYSSPNCFAMLLGGPEQLCASKKALISKIVKAKGADSFTISTLLTFSSKCPTASLRGSNSGFESSKTFDLPLPREWGLAPSSYYVPFMPIIGIP